MLKVLMLIFIFMLLGCSNEQKYKHIETFYGLTMLQPINKSAFKEEKIPRKDAKMFKKSDATFNLITVMTNLNDNIIRIELNKKFINKKEQDMYLKKLLSTVTSKYGDFIHKPISESWDYYEYNYLDDVIIFIDSNSLLDTTITFEHDSYSNGKRNYRLKNKKEQKSNLQDHLNKI